ncbi:MAG: hypothetical protein IKI33_05240, partial [Eubacterium sp.]|nr:hypothetical protein [Eubacterium sp.]
ECYVGGNMEAATSVTTKVIDSLGGLFNITKRGKIEFADQSRIIVGGNMFSSASITLGVLPSGSYTRGRKSNYTVTASEGSNSYYENESDYEESKIITYDGNNYMDKSGAALYLDGKKYKYSDYDEEFAHQDNVIVYNSNDGKYHQKTYDGTVVNYDDGTITDDVSNQGRGVDGNNGLVTTDENTYGAEAFIGGTMIALNGYIKEHAYTCAVVGEYVYAPDYITLRSNADLWVLPETFDNATYEFVPYANKPDGNEYVYTCPHGHRVVSPTKITNARTPCKYCDATCAQCNPDDNTLPNTVGRIYLDLSTEEVQQGPKKSWFARLFETITYNIGKFGYETTQNFMFQPGSVYTFVSLTVNKNASLMGTNNLLQLGAITHGDGSPASNLENAISTIMGTAIGTVTQRKVTLAEDSLVLFGKDISITSAPVSLQLDFFKTKSWAGFDSKGTAGAGVRYICNNWRDPKHANCQYAMTFTAEEASKLTHLTCDVCGAEIWKEGDPNPGIPSQISHPAVMYAGNNLTIVTTVDMLMTYLIADQGEVNLTNFYTKSTHDVNNLKELPNAICSYNKNINYNAWVGQLSSLFYAPVGNINFDGIYTDIYGSVIGNSVQMNAYFQNFHRFENWRTMDLHVAESGNVYMITNHIWDAAPQLGGVYDLTSDSKYEDSPYGVRIFF